MRARERLVSLERVRRAVAARDEAGLRRTLRPRLRSETTLDLAGNDYLGLAHDPRVTEAAANAARIWGAGSTGSRLVTGTTALHQELEAELADFTGGPAALVFSSGYLANLGALTALGGEDVTIVSDAGNHASIIDACRLSRSTIVVVPHRDVDKFDAALAARTTSYAVVVTDAVFSVDGDLAPLREIHTLARRHRALLVVDEAHALGVVGNRGRGAVAAADLAGEEDIVRTVTLSKSLGAQGGAVVAAPDVIELMINVARPFIFDTGLAPASVGAALAALRIVRNEPELASAARSNAQVLAAIVRRVGVETAEPDAAVVPAVVGEPGRAVRVAAAVLAGGVRVGCFRPPSVPHGRSCLRLTARANLTSADLELAHRVLTGALGSRSVDTSPAVRARDEGADT
jgi:8-amino-7-oxononanoate synthase